MKRKLALLFLISCAALSAQLSETRGNLKEATTACTEDSVPRLGSDGKLPLACLPTTVVTLPFIIATPAVLANGLLQLPLPNFAAGTVTSVDCLCRAAGACTVSLNFDARAKTTPLTAGTDLHTSEIVATEGNVAVTSFAGDITNAANEKWNLSISAVTGSPTLLECYLMVERN